VIVASNTNCSECFAQSTRTPHPKKIVSSFIYISVCFNIVLVPGQVACSLNVALGRPATESSVYQGNTLSLPGNAVDGNTDQVTIKCL